VHIFFYTIQRFIRFEQQGTCQSNPLFFKQYFLSALRLLLARTLLLHLSAVIDPRQRLYNNRQKRRPP